MVTGNVPDQFYSILLGCKYGMTVIWNSFIDLTSNSFVKMVWEKIGTFPYWFFHKMSFDYNMKEGQPFLSRKYDNGAHESKAKTIWF